MVELVSGGKEVRKRKKRIMMNANKNSKKEINSELLSIFNKNSQQIFRAKVANARKTTRDLIAVITFSREFLMIFYSSSATQMQRELLVLVLCCGVLTGQALPAGCHFNEDFEGRSARIRPGFINAIFCLFVGPSASRWVIRSVPGVQNLWHLAQGLSRMKLVLNSTCRPSFDARNMPSHFSWLFAGLRKPNTLCLVWSGSVALVKNV